MRFNIGPLLFSLLTLNVVHRQVESFYLSHQAATVVNGSVCIEGGSEPPSLDIYNTENAHVRTIDVDDHGCVFWESLNVNSTSQSLFTIYEGDVHHPLLIYSAVEIVSAKSSTVPRRRRWEQRFCS